MGFKFQDAAVFIATCIGAGAQANGAPPAAVFFIGAVVAALAALIKAGGQYE